MILKESQKSETNAKEIFFKDTVYIQINNI